MSASGWWTPGTPAQRPEASKQVSALSVLLARGGCWCQEETSCLRKHCVAKARHLMELVSTLTGCFWSGETWRFEGLLGKMGPLI